MHVAAELSAALKKWLCHSSGWRQTESPLNQKASCVTHVSAWCTMSLSLCYARYHLLVGLAVAACCGKPWVGTEGEGEHRRRHQG